MFHILDEAEERGEQMAKAAEKYKPKTEEEQKKEAQGEAVGTDGKTDDKGVFSAIPRRTISAVTLLLKAVR